MHTLGHVIIERRERASTLGKERKKFGQGERKIISMSWRKRVMAKERESFGKWERVRTF